MLKLFATFTLLVTLVAAGTLAPDFAAKGEFACDIVCHGLCCVK